MSGYEVEHNIPSTDSRPSNRRPDLSTFFSSLELVDTSDEHTHHNVHAVPQPENMTAAYRLLANAFQMMAQNRGPQNQDPQNQDPQIAGDDILASMIETLQQSANDPPRELQGVPDSFLDELERVPKKALKKTDECPICCNPFLDDEYPLVVRLPCHKDHRFDLECIRPWLKLNSTCPLDRKLLIKKKEKPVTQKIDDEEEDWDDFYA